MNPETKPAPYRLLSRPCGCRLHVRDPGDGRLIPCFQRTLTTYCASHPGGVGAWAPVIDTRTYVAVPEPVGPLFALGGVR